MSSSISICLAELRITGLKCAGCIRNIEKHLSSIAGVSGISINFFMQRGSLQFDKQQISLDQICERIRNLGFGPTVVSCSPSVSTATTSCIRIADSELGMVFQTPSEGVNTDAAPCLHEVNDERQHLGGERLKEDERKTSQQAKEDRVAFLSTMQKTLKSIRPIRSSEARNGQERKLLFVESDDSHQQHATTLNSSTGNRMIGKVGEKESSDYQMLGIAMASPKAVPALSAQSGMHTLILALHSLFESQQKTETLYRRWCRVGKTLNRPLELQSTVEMLRQTPGVMTCHASSSSHIVLYPTLSINYDPHRVGARRLVALIQNHFPCSRLDPIVFDETLEMMENESRSVRVSFALCLIPAIIVLVLSMTPNESLPAVLKRNAFPGVQIASFMMLVFTSLIHWLGGWRIHRHAWKAIANGYTTMDLLVSLSTNITYLYACVALIYSYHIAKLHNNLQDGHVGGSVDGTFHILHMAHCCETPAVVITAILLGKTIETKVQLLTYKAIQGTSSTVDSIRCFLLHEGQRSLQNDNEHSSHWFRLKSKSESSLDGLPAEWKLQSQGSFLPVPCSSSSDHSIVEIDHTIEVDPGCSKRRIHESLLQINDVIVIEKDTVCPVDGIIVGIPNHHNTGICVDESIVTGEAVPVVRSIHDTLIGGSRVLDASVTIKITNLGTGTFQGQIQKVVKSATAQKLKTQLLADRFASYFIPLILTLAALTLSIWTVLVLFNKVGASMNHISGSVLYKIIFITQFPISLLAVACPCALGLATPVAVALATGTAARFGILVRNVEALMEVGAKQITDIVFDKTGTLTTGQFQLMSIHLMPLARWPSPVEQMSSATALTLRSVFESSHVRIMTCLNDGTVDALDSLGAQDESGGMAKAVSLLWYACCLQANSEHPIAKSIVQFYSERLRGDNRLIDWLPPLQQPSEYANMPGEGLTGKVNFAYRLEHPDIMNLAAPSKTADWTDPKKSCSTEVMDTSCCHVATGSSKLCSRILLEWNSEESGSRHLEAVAATATSGHTLVYVVLEGHFVGYLCFTDCPKAEAADVVHQLKCAPDKPTVWMCTGDCSQVASFMGREIGIEQSRIRFQMTPREKAEFIEALFVSKPPADTKSSTPAACRRHASSHRVMMVGDGINDAEALAHASVGVAVAPRSQLPIAAADVLLLSSNLCGVPVFLELSKRATRIIQLNFVWAFGFNAISLPLAAGCFYSIGITLSPAVSGSLMALSSVLVLLNSVRLLLFNPSHQVPLLVR